MGPLCFLLHQRRCDDLTVEVLCLVIDALIYSNPCQCFFFCKMSKDWAWKNIFNWNGFNTFEIVEAIYNRLGICSRSMAGRAVLLGKILIPSCGLSLLEPSRGIGVHSYPRCSSKCMPAMISNVYQHDAIEKCTKGTFQLWGLHTVPDSQIHIDIWCMCFGGIWRQIWADLPETGLWDSNITVSICGHCVPVSCMFDHHVSLCTTVTTDTVGSSTEDQHFPGPTATSEMCTEIYISMWLRRHSMPSENGIVCSHMQPIAKVAHGCCRHQHAIFKNSVGT